MSSNENLLISVKFALVIILEFNALDIIATYKNLIHRIIRWRDKIASRL